MKNFIIITNNPLSAQNNVSDTLYYADADILGILFAVRKKIHCGHALATHPLTSSLKPNETPYKTVLLYKKQGSLCTDSLHLIESAIAVTEKFMAQRPKREWRRYPPNILSDLSTIDYEMVRPILEG